MAALNIVIQLTFLTAIQQDRMPLMEQIGLPLKNNFMTYLLNTKYDTKTKSKGIDR